MESECASSAETAQPAAAAPMLRGEFADACIKIGPERQAVIPDFSPSARGERSRGDERQFVKFSPLREPPPSLPILTLKDVDAAAAAAASSEEASSSKADDVNNPVWTLDDEEDNLADFDEHNDPILPAGVAVGDFCLAMGTNAGQRLPFKAKLLAARRLFPPLLIKYVADASGKRAPSFLMPGAARAYVRRREVQPWVPPEERSGQDGADGSGDNSGHGSDAALDEAGDAAGEGGGRKSYAMRERHVKPPPRLLAEAGGLRLHLDPRRFRDDYEGTGYVGVFDDYWHTGYKRLRPYTVKFDGAYHGRFATVEQAAVQYARLEMGMPPLVVEGEKKRERETS